MLVTFAIFATFADISRRFLASFFFYVLNLVTFVILAIFANFVNEFVIIVSAIFSLATIAKIIC